LEIIFLKSANDCGKMNPWPVSRVNQQMREPEKPLNK